MCHSAGAQQVTILIIPFIGNLLCFLCLHQGADQCLVCSHLMDGPHCVSSCPNGVNGEKGQTIFKYPNAAGHCELCHVNCTGG